MKIITKWDLSTLLKNDSDPSIEHLLKEAEKAYADFADKWKSREDYLELPHILKEALDQYEALERDFNGTGQVGYYFWLRYYQDQTDPFIKSQTNKLSELEVKMGNQVEFFTNRLCKVSPKTQKLLLSYPELKPYRHFLERLFDTAKYTLSEAEEKILNLKDQTSYGNWVKMVSEFVSKEERKVIDESGKKVLKPMADFMGLLSSKRSGLEI